MKALLCAALLCGCAASPRMRLVSSTTSEATWAFVAEDRGGSAQLLIDGRPRVVGCDRAGVTIRCELRGMFPGGHTVELRLAGGMLKRSVIIGPPLPDHPMLVRARDTSTLTGASHAGVDGVVLPAELEPATMDELVEAAHKASLRVFVEGTDLTTAGLIGRYALDGVVGARIDRATQHRFPDARALWIDATGTKLLRDSKEGSALPLTALKGEGLLEAEGALGAGTALLAGRGAIIDGRAFTLLGIRRRHKALREGSPTTLFDDGIRRAVRMSAGGDAVTLVSNAGKEPFTPAIELPPVPIDLLGGPMSATGPTVPPGELAAILASPDPDRTRY